MPGFLASTFSRDVAVGFRDGLGYPPEAPGVLWVVHVDPAGEHDPSKRCKHAYLIASHLRHELEFLFTAYSVFTVRSVEWGEGDAPNLVELDAATDNDAEPLDLPLAPWY